MNERMEARLRNDLAAVEAAPTASVDQLGRAVGAAERRMVRRRRATAGVAGGVLAIAAVGVLWGTSGGPEEVTTGDGGAPTTLIATTVDEPATTVTLPLTTPITAAVEEGTGTWIGVPPNPLGITVGAQVVWTGTEAVLLGGADQQGNLVDGVAAYDPAMATWRTVSPDPVPLMWPMAVWTGDHVLTVGWDHDLQNTRAAVLDVTTGAWTMGQVTPFGYKSTPLVPHDWTGTEFLLYADHPLAYDPVADSWRQLPDAPMQLSAGVRPVRQSSASVWTGSEWVIWGGNDGAEEYADGAAYDPASNTWRLLAEGPLSKRSLRGAIWTGSEMLVIAGYSGGDRSTGNGAMALSSGAAYEPATDTWRRLAAGPAHPGFVPVFDGSTLYVFAKGGVSTYVVDTDVWTGDFAGVPFCHDATSPVWTGTQIVLLGCYDGTTGGVVLTPTPR